MYRPQMFWYVKEAFKLVTVGIITDICFFRNVSGLLFELPMLLLVLADDYRDEIIGLKDKFVLVFCDVLQSVCASVGAGRSLENAFAEAVQEIAAKNDVDISIKNQWKKIVIGLNCNQDIEDLLDKLGRESGISEIKKLVWLIGIAKIHGGDLLQLMRSFNQSMSRKRILKEELNTMVTEKRLESSIMIAMPYLIITYVRLVNPGTLEVVYSCLLGRIIMGIAVLTVFFAYMLQRKIISVTEQM